MVERIIQSLFSVLRQAPVALFLLGIFRYPIHERRDTTVNSCEKRTAIRNVCSTRILRIINI